MCVCMFLGFVCIWVGWVVCCFVREGSYIEGGVGGGILVCCSICIFFWKEVFVVLGDLVKKCGKWWGWG